jgi:predicted enzyme related to lactoylglutathione lyase
MMAGEPAQFIWYELMTSDLPAALEFYRSVVGWTTAEQKMSELEFRYEIISAGPNMVAGAMALTDDMCAGGARPGWIGTIGVPDTDAAANRVVQAGGSLHMGPADIPNVGRFAMVADPGGAVFQLMTPIMPEEAPPAPTPNAPGHVGWHELYAADGQEAAFAFYSEQFGWTTAQMMDMGECDGQPGSYRIFAAGGEPIGAMMNKPAEAPIGAWQFYFTVDAIDAAVGRIQAGGGTVLMGPMAVPDDNWIVMATDPQGANFALVAPKR